MKDENYDLDDVLPGKKSSREDVLSDLKSLTSDESYDDFMPSSFVEEMDKRKEEKAKEIGAYDESDKWFNDMFNSYSYDVGIDKHAKIQDDLFAPRKKKKKKKKKDKDQLVDYSKELETESGLLTNLLIDQNKLTESLQKEYNYLMSRKGSARGVSKQMNDLIENITNARSLSTQLVKEKISLKKLIAELSLKQKKEFGIGNNDDLNDFGSNFLKQMLLNRNTITGNTNGESAVSEYNEDEIYNEVSSSLGEDTRPEEVQKYIKYENSNVEIFVVIINNDVENYTFLAEDENGNILDDYPLPNHTSISVNRSTNVATDAYGKKYNIIWHNDDDDEPDETEPDELFNDDEY